MPGYFVYKSGNFGSWVLCEYIQGMAEVGESSGAKPCEEFWAKLVPSDSRYPDVEISSREIVVCSEILFSSIRKCKWCKISMDAEHAICCNCLNIWHDVVTVAPCFHNFCNGCFSEWLKRSLEKRSSVLCPHCRAVVQFVGRNHFLLNVVDEILQADSSLKRTNDEVAILDSYATIQSNLVVKRAHSQVDEEAHNPSNPCPQCGTEYGAFRCNQTTIHLQCQACGGMMPSCTNKCTSTLFRM
ncbi:uncharacterized protein LOC126589058 isoform X1 [Malus sylvestris]|uniref:uncharacterized protein LOC126589058 isoform X1 n=1 Tax=Malus sylvestris TaxID=3752 RepID=UPI0021AC2DB4|nr:uncharacterized protein LOC126589058 isoform X1 [Malus sylvestris]